jgi:tRNA pseudouridine38-40 synthase
LTRLKSPSEHKRTYLAHFAFDGARFAGWQVQPNACTVQQTLEEAFEKVTQTPVRLCAAGRTDAGVHGLDFPADFTVAFDLDTDLLRNAWNSVTPEEITVLSIRPVPTGFSARHRAERRTYRFLILNRELPSPFLRRYSWHIAEKLDMLAIQQAMNSLLGEHDFSAFRAAGCEAAHPIRRIVEARIDDVFTAGGFADQLDWWPVTGGAEPGLLCLTIGGTAFLRHQVRAIVGTLAQVGSGRMTPRQFAEVLASRDRAQAGLTAPAHGLTLVRVDFPPAAFEDQANSDRYGVPGGSHESD